MKHLFVGVVLVLTFTLVGGALLGAIDALKSVPWWVWLVVNPLTLGIVYSILFGTASRPGSSTPKTVGGERPTNSAFKSDAVRSAARAEGIPVRGTQNDTTGSSAYPRIYTWSPIFCDEVGTLKEGDDEGEVLYDVKFSAGDPEVSDERFGWGVRTTLSGKRGDGKEMEWNIPLLSPDFLRSANKHRVDLAGMIKFASVLVERDRENENEDDEDDDAVCIIWCYRLESLEEALVREGLRPQPHQNLRHHVALRS